MASGCTKIHNFLVLISDKVAWRVYNHHEQLKKRTSAAVNIQIGTKIFFKFLF